MRSSVRIPQPHCLHASVILRLLTFSKREKRNIGTGQPSLDTFQSFISHHKGSAACTFTAIESEVEESTFPNSQTPL